MKLSKVTIEELANEVVKTWGRYFRPCEYVWLHHSCRIEKIKCPRYEDMSTDEIKRMDEHHLFAGHHFGKDSAYPVIKLLMEKEGYSIDDIRLGSNRTPFDIYAGRFDRKGQVIPVEIGTITHITKLMESYKDKVKSVWLYNYGDFVYVFGPKPKAKNLCQFIVENGNKEIIECLRKRPDSFYDRLRNFDFDKCVFVRKLTNKIPCSFEEAYFESRILETLAWYFSNRVSRT